MVDRVGNVLAVYRMTGAGSTVDITSGSGKNKADQPQGLDGLSGFIGADLAAIAKAITGAYLSSSGNAFSTRTASFIIQEHFGPGIANTAGGPLFGVQFSQLPCGDLVTRGAGVGVGPKRSPLGLAGDPGGFPLYKNGQVVGGVGVIADGVYSLDLVPTASGPDLDERIAQAALNGFAAPACIRSDRISLGGVTPAYSNSDAVLPSVSVRTLHDPQIVAAGALLAVAGYYDAGAVLAGTAVGDAASGIVADGAGFAARRGYLLGDGTATGNRYPVQASRVPAPGPGAGSGMAAAEVQEILGQALGVANAARAQIRSPVGTAAQVTISVVDNGGNVLGTVRSADAPVFGIDVAVQKARTAAFFSSAQVAATLSALAPVGYFNGKATGGAFVRGPLSPIDAYLNAQPRGARAFFNQPNIFADGTAFSVRAIGNIARPNFPDGIDGNPNGPFSKPDATWSPFNTGLQLDLVYNRLVTAILAPGDSGNSCTGDANLALLKNGAQIFPGGFPIYRGATLVGGIGVSGDGVDQDDMIAMLGLYRAGRLLGAGIGHAPASARADTLTPQGRRLRYAQCPQAPFIGSIEQDVCDGI